MAEDDETHPLHHLVTTGPEQLFPLPSRQEIQQAGIGSCHHAAALVELRRAITDLAAAAGVVAAGDRQEASLDSTILALAKALEAAGRNDDDMIEAACEDGEASLLATLSHPAIPKVYDFFAERSKIYLVMELIAGHDLSATLDIVGGAIEEARVGRWALQICDVPVAFVR
jgi:hypothetical protein